MHPLVAPALLFLSNALMHITLFIRLPEIATGAGLDKAELGLAMLAGTVGTLLALPIAGTVTDRLTPRVAAASMLCANAAMMPLFALVPGWAIPVMFAVYTFIRSILEVAQNMVAIGIEHRTGKSVLSRSHGFWSVGLLVGSLLAGAIAGVGTVPALHQAIISGLVLVLMAGFLAIAPRSVPLSRLPGAERGPLFAVPTIPVLLVCAMVIGISLTEGTVYDWSVFYLQEVVGIDVATAGVVFAAFTVGMGGTRMVGDMLRARFSGMVLVRGSALVCIAGMTTLLLAEGPIVAGLGLFMLGAGVALNAPLGVTVISRLPGRSPSQNMAAMSLAMLIATFGVPAGFGYVAEYVGLAAVFAGLIPLLVLSFLMAPVAGRFRPRDAQPQPA
ncbi:MFS transporter [Pelagibacterium sp. 26DY04]|uniref:MFS transporter n=1 Tax=Pelagibacterium sp. 26DY04 TaxID=2967130 RepID=UPI00281630FF|nr:MFS transporter [Pelagibacterium sp. 26DY04]WMT88617.1 MFS transporter [Pelagibacterium sp. 26DY04]